MTKILVQNTAFKKQFLLIYQSNLAIKAELHFKQLQSRKIS